METDKNSIPTQTPSHLFSDLLAFSSKTESLNHVTLEDNRMVNKMF